MKIQHDPRTKRSTPASVALGCFDGVHAGHAAVIGEAVAYARAHGITGAVWSFSAPPKNAFLDVPVPLLSDEKEKARLCASLGADLLICPDFTPDLRRISPEDFVGELLCRCTGAVHIVCGDNYTFGEGGRGTTADLIRRARENGAAVTVVPCVRQGQTAVSSTAIRRAIAAGSMRRASELLCRVYSVNADIEDDKNDPSLSRFTIPAGLVAPADGCYLITAERAGCRVNADARVLRDGAETLVLLPRGVPTGKDCRVFFRSDKLPRKPETLRIH